MTIIPEMALEFIPQARRNRVKSIAKGATSRRVALAVSRTYVKQSIVEALRKTVLECVHQDRV
jgi:LysR family hydrogen peroxide-inducible transcriptional activator